MWCILKCRPGRSGEIMASCRQTIPDSILQDIFVFTCDRMKRYQGSWHIEKTSMFPDYVFLETGNIRALSECLEPYREFTCVLEDEAEYHGLLRRVSPEEEIMLRRLGGPEHHLGISQGYISDGITHVTQGPLVGMERRIRKIDRHKRIAWIEYPADGAGGSRAPFTAGLEITSKT